MNSLEILSSVKAFVFDIDGVLTNGEVLILPPTQPNQSLTMARTMHTKDGYAMQLAIKQGYPMAIISGGKESGAEKRLEYLGVKHIFMGIGNKKECLIHFAKEQNIAVENILYMGDDIPDFDIMQYAGIKACPNDAVIEIKSIAQYISPLNGGKGCVRDVIEKVLKLQGNWPIHNTVKTI